MGRSVVVSGAETVHPLVPSVTPVGAPSGATRSSGTGEHPDVVAAEAAPTGAMR